MSRQKRDRPRHYTPRGRMTQREVGERFQISQTRVAQIEEGALQKLVRGLQASEELQEAYAELG